MKSHSKKECQSNPISTSVEATMDVKREDGYMSRPVVVEKDPVVGRSRAEAGAAAAAVEDVQTRTQRNHDGEHKHESQVVEKGNGVAVVTKVANARVERKQVLPAAVGLSRKRIEVSCRGAPIVVENTTPTPQQSKMRQMINTTLSQMQIQLATSSRPLNDTTQIGTQNFTQTAVQTHEIHKKALLSIYKSVPKKKQKNLAVGVLTFSSPSAKGIATSRNKMSQDKRSLTSLMASSIRENNEKSATQRHKSTFRANCEKLIKLQSLGSTTHDLIEKLHEKQEHVPNDGLHQLGSNANRLQDKDERSKTSRYEKSQMNKNAQVNVSPILPNLHTFAKQSAAKKEKNPVDQAQMHLPITPDTNRRRLLTGGQDTDEEDSRRAGETVLQLPERRRPTHSRNAAKSNINLTQPPVSPFTAMIADQHINSDKLAVTCTNFQNQQYNRNKNQSKMKTQVDVVNQSQTKNSQSAHRQKFAKSDHSQVSLPHRTSKLFAKKDAKQYESKDSRESFGVACDRSLSSRQTADRKQSQSSNNNMAQAQAYGAHGRKSGAFGQLLNDESRRNGAASQLLKKDNKQNMPLPGIQQLHDSSEKKRGLSALELESISVLDEAVNVNSRSAVDSKKNMRAHTQSTSVQVKKQWKHPELNNDLSCLQALNSIKTDNRRVSISQMNSYSVQTSMQPYLPKEHANYHLQQQQQQSGQTSSDQQEAAQMPVTAGVHSIIQTSNKAASIEGQRQLPQVNSSNMQGVSGIIIPRKFTQIVPPQINDFGTKTRSQPYNQFANGQRRQATSSLDSTKSNKQVKKIYLNQPSKLITMSNAQTQQLTPGRAHTNNNYASLMRQQHENAPVTAYPVSSANHNPHKPIQISTRQQYQQHHASLTQSNSSSHGLITTHSNRDQDGQEITSGTSYNQNAAKVMIQYPHGKVQPTLDASAACKTSIRLPDLISNAELHQQSYQPQQLVDGGKKHLYGGANSNAVSRMSEHLQSHSSAYNTQQRGGNGGHQVKTKSSFDSRGLVQPTFQPVLQEQRMQRESRTRLHGSRESLHNNLPTPNKNSKKYGCYSGLSNHTGESEARLENQADSGFQTASGTQMQKQLQLILRTNESKRDSSQSKHSSAYHEQGSVPGKIKQYHGQKSSIQVDTPFVSQHTDKSGRLTTMTVCATPLRKHKITDNCTDEVETKVRTSLNVIEQKSDQQQKQHDSGIIETFPAAGPDQQLLTTDLTPQIMHDASLEWHELQQINQHSNESLMTADQLRPSYKPQNKWCKHGGGKERIHDEMQVFDESQRRVVVIDDEEATRELNGVCHIVMQAGQPEASVSFAAAKKPNSKHMTIRSQLQTSGNVPNKGSHMRQSSSGKRSIMQKNQFRLRKETRRSIESFNESGMSFAQRPHTKGSKKGLNSSQYQFSKQQQSTNNRLVQQIYNQVLVPKRNVHGFTKDNVIGGQQPVQNFQKRKRSSSSSRRKSLQNARSMTSKVQIISQSYSQVKEQPFHNQQGAMGHLKQGADGRTSRSSLKVTQKEYDRSSWKLKQSFTFDNINDDDALSLERKSGQKTIKAKQYTIENASADSSLEEQQIRQAKLVQSQLKKERHSTLTNPPYAHCSTLHQQEQQATHQFNSDERSLKQNTVRNQQQTFKVRQNAGSRINSHQLQIQPNGKTGGILQQYNPTERRTRVSLPSQQDKVAHAIKTLGHDDAYDSIQPQRPENGTGRRQQSFAVTAHSTMKDLSGKMKQSQLMRSSQLIESESRQKVATGWQTGGQDLPSLVNQQSSSQNEPGKQLVRKINKNTQQISAHNTVYNIAAFNTANSSNTSLLLAKKEKTASRDKFITMTSNRRDYKPESRHGSVPRQPSSITSSVVQAKQSSTNKKSRSPTTLKNDYNTSKDVSAMYQAPLDRVTLAKQFDQHRRKLTASKSPSTDLHQNHRKKQEALTIGMLKMMESTASLNYPESPQKPTIRGQTTKSQSQQPQPSQQQAESVEVFRNKMFTLDEFEHIRVLGRGSFGHVTLVRHRATDELFAMKQISKERIRGAKHIQHVNNEKNILRSISSQAQKMQQAVSGNARIDDGLSFFVDFIESLQDDQNLYLLLEYLPGGELLQQIRQQMSLTMSDSVFYLAEILVAIQQLHDRNIIYRDLKPENILLDRCGHIKLIDFGFSKQLTNLKNQKARTNCGTPAYAAPEVLIGTGYTYKADLWSFGILICEILGGFTPFGPKAMEIGVAQDGIPDTLGAGVSSMHPQQIIEMVNSGRIILPKNLNPVTRDIVRKILVADPNVRLEIKDIMQHKFFEGVDWSNVAKKLIQPPYVPPQRDELVAAAATADTGSETRHIASPSRKQTTQMHQQQQLVIEENLSSTATESRPENSYGASNSNQAHQKLVKQSSGTSANNPLQSPYTRRQNPNKMILGDFHLAKLNQVFENF